MVKSTKRLPPRQQFCSIAEGERVFTTIVLMRLRNFYRQQVGLEPIWNDVIPFVVIAHIFLAGYEHYHGFVENMMMRWERCRRDFEDYVDEKIDLERYVMSAYEAMLKHELVSHPATNKRTRFLEAERGDRLLGLDIEMANVLALISGPVPSLALAPTAVSRVIVESSKYGQVCREEGRDLSNLPDASQFVLPDKESGPLVPFVLPQEERAT